jgi:hypothetical protein
MSKINSSQIIADYKAAYFAANKRPIEITFKNGWFITNQCNRHRANQIIQFTLVLNARAKSESNGFYN